METKTEKVNETENQNGYCIWKFPASVYWKKELEATQKCLDCPARCPVNKEYCDLSKFIINKDN